MEVITAQPKKEGKTETQFTTASFYSSPPLLSDNLNLDRFEAYAFDRLNLLKTIDDLVAKGGLSDHKTFSKTLKSEIKKFGLDKFEKDLCSHYILRFAFCRSDNSRRWFIEQELQLFRFRLIDQHNYEDLSSEFIPTIVKKNDDRQLYAKLENDYSDSIEHGSFSKYYKVPFEKCLKLVGSHSVTIVKGEAYVPESKLLDLIVSKYRTELSRGISNVAKALSNIPVDDRTELIIKSIIAQDTGAKFQSAVVGSVKPSDIPQLAQESFPLCMQHLYDCLVRDSHLRHFGRQQLGLFLKGIGLSMDDALAFWKAAFAKKIPADKFDKMYAYNIRHNFGKEGKRIISLTLTRCDYTPFSCMKIIGMRSSSRDDHHGCPFVQFDTIRLRAYLGKKIKPDQVEKIIELTSKKHYQIACANLWEYSHSTAHRDKVGNHPNQYFVESRKYYLADSKTQQSNDKIE